MFRSLLADGDGTSTDAGEIGGLPSYFMASFYPPMAPEIGGGGPTEVGPVDRASVASKNHREAEKRRRERIKSHLDRLRVILACDPKIDKATLLAKAVEHVRDLKQRTAEIISGTRTFPTETDEIVVLPGLSDGQTTLFEASVSCDDRPDLLPQLMETLRSLHMRALRAEIATLGGRVRNVMVLAREKAESMEEEEEAADENFLKEALVTLVNRSGSLDRTKRRRVMEYP